MQSGSRQPTLVTVAEDREFKRIKMQTIWLLVQTCIVPIITYGSETWHLKKQEKKKMNQILDKIIKKNTYDTRFYTKRGIIY